MARPVTFAVMEASDTAPSSFVPRRPATMTVVVWKEYWSKYVTNNGVEYCARTFDSVCQFVWISGFRLDASWAPVPYSAFQSLSCRHPASWARRVVASDTWAALAAI